MISRYPHTATIKINSQTDADGDGIPENTTQEIEIAGRYEPNKGNKNLDYSATFFVKGRLDILDSDRKALDGQRLDFEGSFINIVRAWNYQTHTVLWLD